jgi:hypothetical protein
VTDGTDGRRPAGATVGASRAVGVTCAFSVGQPRDLSAALRYVAASKRGGQCAKEG